jgi:hypothetical protein
LYHQIQLFPVIESLHPAAARPIRSVEAARETRAPVGVKAWLLCSVVLSAGGWVLSAARELNATGYAVLLGVSITGFLIWRGRKIGDDLRAIHLNRLIRRFRKPLPLGFLVLAIFALAGGLIYRPVNYDALAYRVPRALHWLAHGQWHWVHTDFNRLNVRACGYEWLMAPLLALTKSDRWLFLPSFISFLLLPGLFYSVFTKFGVKPRVAWHWMWIVATGYGYVTQAGSIANDLLGATYALCAFEFGLRLRQEGKVQDLRWFVIATGLLTGAKASNFPLLLPLFLLFCPRVKLLLVEPVKNFFAIALAALASFLPTAIFNFHYAGDWTGMKLEGPMKGPVAQFGINVVNWFIMNLCPPVFPFSAMWDKLVHKIPGLSKEAWNCFGIPELTAEEGAGLGVGVVLLLIISIMSSRWIRRRAQDQNAPAGVTAYWKWVLWSPYIALIVFAFKAQAVHSVTRLIIPYYAVLIVPWLVFCFDGRILQRRWWKGLVGIVFAVALFISVLAPARPLWPAETVLGKLHDAHPSLRLITRAQSVYWLYKNRPVAFTPLLAALPADGKVFGMLTFDDPETSLWWPMGSRRIEHVKVEDARETLESRGIQYVIAPEFCAALSTSADDLIRKYDAKVVAKVPLFIRTVPGLTDWYVLQLPSPGSPKI